MVRVTAVLARVPVIKFRKGGLSLPGTNSPAAGAASSPPPATAGQGSAAPHQMQSSAAMSTSPIPDIDLPLRYKRIPLSEEEIEHINGGGIKDPPQSQSQSRQEVPVTMGVIKVPRGVLIDCGNKKKDIVSLNIVLQRCRPNK